MLSAAFQHISCLSVLLQWIKWKPSEKWLKIWRKNPSWSCQTCWTMNEEWLWVEAGTTQETNNDSFLAFLSVQWSQAILRMRWSLLQKLVLWSLAHCLPSLLVVSCCEHHHESGCNKNCWSWICCFSIDYWWVVTCCTLFMSEGVMNDLFYWLGLKGGWQ